MISAAAASKLIYRLPAPSSSQISSPSSSRQAFGREPSLAGLHNSRASNALLGLTPATDTPDSIGSNAVAEQEQRLVQLSKFLSSKQNRSAICHPWHDLHWVAVGEELDWPCLIAFGGMSEAILSKCHRVVWHMHVSYRYDHTSFSHWHCLICIIRRARLSRRVL